MVVPIVNGIHTREDVWSLPRWDPTLLWYAKAVGVLWPKPIADPTSWRYQAAIHGYGPMEQPQPEPDPLSQPGEALPADKASYWHQCQHGVWYFLPWHRGYIGYFEKLVRKTIVTLGGPADWALPYWNYSDQSNANTRLMRPEFLDPTLPDGTPNALVSHIRRGAHKPVTTLIGQAGDFGIGPKQFSLDCLNRKAFNDTSSALDFGGTASGFLHEGAGVGALEAVPHGSVHTAVGQWMGSFNTAALDPIFWVHHSNIDRLWEVWLGQTTPHRQNPTNPAWLSPTGAGMPFRIHDENGQATSYSPTDVVDTRSPLFAYQYAGVAPHQPAARAGLLDFVETMTPTEPQLVAASTTEIRVLGELTIPVHFDPKGSERSLKGAVEAFLNFENVTGSGPLPAYSAYLDLPPGADLANSDPYYVGLLPMFGVAEASGLDGPHAGNGLTYVLDITKLANHLKAEGRWHEETVTVTLAPEGVLSAKATLRVGRISLYYR
jgi:tyrosinase